MATSNQQNPNGIALTTRNGGQTIAISEKENLNFEPPRYETIALTTRALLTQFVYKPGLNALARLGGELERTVEIAHQVMMATQTNSAVATITLDTDSSFLGVVARSRIEPLPYLPIAFNVINDWEWYQSKLMGQYSVHCERRDCEAQECLAFTTVATEHFPSTPAPGEVVDQWIEQLQDGCVRVIYDLSYRHHLGHRLELWYGCSDCKLLLLRYIHKLPLILATHIDYQLAKDHTMLGAFHDPHCYHQPNSTAWLFARETPTRISVHLNARREHDDLE